MTLKRYLLAIAVATAVCATAFLYVASSVNPNTTNQLGFLFFYGSLFLTLFGFTALFGFLIRFVALKHELAFYSVRNAYRQAFLFSAFIIILLCLLAKNLFTWLNLAILGTLFIIIEAILTRPSKNRL
ncbi:MAG: hypothetical protein ACOX6C_00060 [Patescibacteria group bacterium]|jgi:hypothetical protein